MAQFINSRFVCDGRYRVHAVDGIGRRKPRIIEIEVVDTGERFHGSARWLQKFALELAKRTRMSSEQQATTFLTQWITSRIKRP